MTEIDDMKARARRLYEACEAVVQSLDPKDFPGAAVNWGDVHCVEALVGFDEEGDLLSRVTIAEAVENNREIQIAVFGALLDEFGPVGVRLRW